MNKPLHVDQISHLFPLNALAPRQLQQLRDQLTPRALGRGEALFEAGAGVNATYFLLKGALAPADRAANVRSWRSRRRAVGRWCRGPRCRVPMLPKTRVCS